MWVRIASPLAVALTFLAAGAFVLRTTQPNLVFWLFVATAFVVVAAEVHKRSYRVSLDGETVEDHDLLRTRRLSLADLTATRLYRDKRLWLYFSSDPRPVWLLKGMANLRAVHETVLSRARALGADPKEVTVEAK
jgi:hypothetical protein